ncbi:hypothetical protein GGI25_004888 [Coemansia spiralis]|uniref:Uncharacterized protein n=2 Tax=Coemansia TaxID=4863 RepID=A0A9W8KWY7_9FUNG|nr:armadillo-type protein [Coemansia spiralis]KAJ1990835.1 hypothetical protein EDC05_003815 [Coemansia umbellata]KAJ2622621.1 hypothetical protein GGI26_003067 [Coemansia sp. RSA 1358]KAJ2672907.1 hypothetical protein GGI25_004888 [Coemansia spiralis]
MSNTAISPEAMHAVLQQLPQMSGKIVDDTRHEKVLSYMRLFLSSPMAIQTLQSWDALETLAVCLKPTSDYRVSAVAVRFLGDLIAVSEGEIWPQIDSKVEVAQWVVDNADSQYALVRFSCVYFVRMAVDEGLLERLDYKRYVLRRLLDASYFVVAEACRLLGILVHRGGEIDPVLSGMMQMLVERPFELQSTARKLAVLSATSTLYSSAAERVRGLGLQILSLDKLRPYLFDKDRLVRDRALDVLENTLRLCKDGGCLTRLGCLLCEQLEDATAEPRTSAVVALRVLAAMAKEAPANKHIVNAAGRCKSIVATVLSIFLDASDIDIAFDAEPASSWAELARIRRYVLAVVGSADSSSAGTKNSILLEAARAAREFCRSTFDEAVVGALLRLLDHKRVQNNAQVFHLVLDAIVRSLRLTQHRGHLLMLPGLVANFAIRAPGLKVLFELALEVLAAEAEQSVELVGGLVRAVRERLADVEWEARDTALEFVAAAVRTLGWDKARTIVCGDQVQVSLVDDLVESLSDPEEYVRASGAQTLTAIVSSADAPTVQAIAQHGRLGRESLRRLLGDSEAVVKRAALDLVCSMCRAAGVGGTESREWLHALNFAGLHQTSDDADFEVRVRCARLLGLLARWAHAGAAAEADQALAGELQPGALLIDMCQDSSRYVRQACLDELAGMRRELAEHEGPGALEAGEREQHRPKRQAVGPGRDTFLTKLQGVDLRRLEGSLTAEHLYQEALDTQVERELMAESHAPNEGNNILDCY